MQIKKNEKEMKERKNLMEVKWDKKFVTKTKLMGNVWTRNLFVISS